MCWVRHMSTVLDYVSRSPGAHVSQLLLYEAHRIDQYENLKSILKL